MTRNARLKVVTGLCYAAIVALLAAAEFLESTGHRGWSISVGAAVYFVFCAAIDYTVRWAREKEKPPPAKKVLEIKIEQDGHGIEVAFYASDGEHYFPVMECLCGWDTGRCIDWEDAGNQLDGHLGTAAPGARRPVAPVTESPNHLSDGGCDG